MLRGIRITSSHSERKISEVELGKTSERKTNGNKRAARYKSEIGGDKSLEME